MEILGDFNTSVQKALGEIDPNYQKYDGLIVCGTHTPHNVEEQIEKIRIARNTNRPTLLICAGYQMGAIQWARENGIPYATSEEYSELGTPVVKRRKEMKIGLHDGESWWSNYEVVVNWEIPDWFVAAPFHPEYQSSKENPHPLLVEFINICRKHKSGNVGWHHR